jgi:hypothetical protein
VPGPVRIALSLCLLAFAVGIAACGGDEETTTTTTTPTTSEAEGDAFIDLTTGEAEGLDPDERVGIEPEGLAVLELSEAADAADCDLELDLPQDGPATGSLHVPSSEPVSYETAPPTSGLHDDVPLADGAYLTEPDPRYFVHSMEHGRVVIAYQPDLPEEEQLELKGLLQQDPDGMILIPYSDMPYDVAAVAWQNLLGCDAYGDETLAAIAAFRDEFRGNGPEDIPL